MDPGLRIVTKHLRILDHATGILHFRKGDVLLIEDIGPKMCHISNGEHRCIQAPFEKIEAHTTAAPDSRA